MKATLIGACIIALGLAAGGYLAGGRYELISVRGNELARLDKLTGEVLMCVNGVKPEPCGFKLD